MITTKNTNAATALNQTNTNKIITAAKYLTLGLGLAVGLAACSLGTPAPEAAAPGTTVLVGERIQTLPPDVDGNDNGNEVERVTVPGATPTTKPAVKPVQLVACTAAEFPTTTYVEATADLNIRRGPGTSHAAFSSIKQGDFIEFDIYADNHGCVRVPGNGVWWAVWDHDLQMSGWSHSSYLRNDIPVPDFHGEEISNNGWVDDGDVHIDCVIILDSPCAEVSRRSDGSIEQVFSTLSADDLATAQADCVYNANPEACELLTVLGFTGATNYGLGNSLTQIPTDVLVDGCYSDDHSLGPVDLLCAELFAREGGSGH